MVPVPGSVLGGGEVAGEVVGVAVEEDGDLVGRQAEPPTVVVEPSMLPPGESRHGPWGWTCAPWRKGAMTGSLSMGKLAAILAAAVMAPWWAALRAWDGWKWAGLGTWEWCGVGGCCKW